MSASTTYRYQVPATDAAGNVSANSSIASATTAVPPETTAPSAPGGLNASHAWLGREILELIHLGRKRPGSARN